MRNEKRLGNKILNRFFVLIKIAFYVKLWYIFKKMVSFLMPSETSEALVSEIKIKIIFRRYYHEH